MYGTGVGPNPARVGWEYGYLFGDMDNVGHSVLTRAGDWTIVIGRSKEPLTRGGNAEQNNLAAARQVMASCVPNRDS